MALWGRVDTCIRNRVERLLGCSEARSMTLGFLVCLASYSVDTIGTTCNVWLDDRGVNGDRGVSGSGTATAEANQEHYVCADDY